MGITQQIAVTLIPASMDPRISFFLPILKTVLETVNLERFTLGGLSDPF